ncbi:hypothetical protein AB5J72_24135 [Streptomyces sp. CG1]|uniref:hypothetical protein n=1 Tax=Streptomyces sp. CG1 TaxID=1287523 RepID=UPI0034E263B0
MEQPWKTVTGAGTLDDMLEDARLAGFDIQKRTIHAWVARGLLDHPLRRGAGRGSRPGLHSENQRKLFLLLLSKRREMPKLSTLALVPLSLWLWWGDQWVPSRQAFRAFMTWFRDGARSKETCHDAARRVLEQLDHPMASEAARARLVRTFAEISYRSRVSDTDLKGLAAAARAVFEPASVFGSTGLVRAVGPHVWPVTVEAVLTPNYAVAAATQALRDDRVTERHLGAAKALYRRLRKEYEESLPFLRAHTADPLSGLFVGRTSEEDFNNVGSDLLMFIGLLLTSPLARAEAGGFGFS